MLSEAAIEGIQEFGPRWRYFTSVPKRPEDIDLSDLESLERWLWYLQAISHALTKSDRLKAIMADIIEDCLKDVIELQQEAIEEYKKGGEQQTWESREHFEDEMKYALDIVYDEASYWRIYIGIRDTN